jgi:hypothetical protein
MEALQPLSLLPLSLSLSSSRTHTPSGASVTIDHENESDTSCVVITESPNSLSGKEKNLEPKADAWVSDDVVEPLPPFFSDSLDHTTPLFNHPLLRDYSSQDVSRRTTHSYAEAHDGLARNHCWTSQHASPSSSL